VVFGFGSAFLAAHLPDGTVELEHILATCLLMIAIHVLRDQRYRGLACQLGQGSMSGVGLGVGNQAASPVVPPPDQFGISAESLGGGQFLRPVATPEAVLLSPESGNAACCGYAGARQDGHAGRWLDAVADFRQGPGQIRIAVHIDPSCLSPGEARIGSGDAVDRLAAAHRLW